MIKLEELVSATQAAVFSSAGALAQSNIDVFRTYFEEVGDEDELTARVQASLSAVNAAIDTADQSAAESALRDAAEALRAAAERVRRQSGGGDDPGGDQVYVPKRVVLQYPSLEGGVPGVHHVHVPLITLVPISMPEVTEVRFKTELELSIADDDSLRVSFPPPRDSTTDRGSTPMEGSAATLEIVINGRQPADGLRKIVEGYEKALRAQIPG